MNRWKDGVVIAGVSILDDFDYKRFHRISRNAIDTSMCQMTTSRLMDATQFLYAFGLNYAFFSQIHTPEQLSFSKLSSKRYESAVDALTKLIHEFMNMLVIGQPFLHNFYIE
jgi:hypothetical protein